MNVPKKVIDKVAKTNAKLNDWFVARDYEPANPRYTWKTESEYVDTDVLPSEFGMALAAEWLKQAEDDWKKNEGDYQRKREYEHAGDFEKTIIDTKKLQKNKATSLPKLATKLTGMMGKKLGERCWTYFYNEKAGMYLPKLVKSIKYVAASDSRDEYASVVISMVNISNNGSNTSAVYIDTDDMRQHNRDAEAILKSHGFIWETKELYKAYTDAFKDYEVKAEWQNKQITSGDGKYINDNVWHRGNKRSYGITTAHSNFSPRGKMMDVPSDLTIYAFHLTEHGYRWLYAPTVKEYVYDESIEEKIVLPEEHKDLINILLSSDIKSMGSDIIEGKGDGTIILSKGPAGVGKTVTAEVFSEKKHLPLYSVHSGQLGISGETLERKMKEVFEKVERWGCILLLDEADVYIRKRDNDVNHNAIVASLLRILEYYSGIMFMTTNRIEDVDEAIASRCSAVLKYQNPDDEQRFDLWKLFIDQYNLEVSAVVVDELTEKMENISGRDIKNICALVSRYVQGHDKEKEKTPYAVFKTCATFRGLYSIG